LSIVGLLSHFGSFAEPTSGQHQVDNEDSLLFSEIETDDGEASVLPASRGSQAAPTVTTGGVVGGPLQHIEPTFHTFARPDFEPPPNLEPMRAEGEGEEALGAEGRGGCASEERPELRASILSLGSPVQYVLSGERRRHLEFRF
jgi:hypothetical protein